MRPPAPARDDPEMMLRLVLGCTRRRCRRGRPPSRSRQLACSVCRSSRSRWVASTRRNSADLPPPDATIASSFRRCPRSAADSAALSSRWRYRVNALAYALASLVATLGTGSATENLSRSSVGSALTLEFASSAAAVRSGNPGPSPPTLRQRPREPAWPGWPRNGRGSRGEPKSDSEPPRSSGSVR